MDAAIYAQKIDSNGNIQWLIDGVAICTYGAGAVSPKICSDGAGGAIITWADYRSGNSDVYAQLVDSNGNTQWTPNGTDICTANSYQAEPQICSDGAGGAIITWHDYRGGLDYDIYAQKIDSSGNGQWIADGVVICNASNLQTSPQICNDGAGGAIITWIDYRTGNSDIYAQLVDSSGDVQLKENGLAISIVNGDQEYPQICGDEGGNAIITW